MTLSSKTVHENLIYILDDDEMFCQSVSSILESLAVVETYQQPDDFLKAIDRQRPDLAMIDLNLGQDQDDGFEVIKKIKSRNDSHLIPMLMISGADDSDILQKAFRSGVEDYVQKPLMPRIFLAKVDHVLYQAHQKIHMNPLTGLPGNRIIEKELKLRQSYNSAFSVAYLDLDNFKPFNDTKGIKKGDKAIDMIAAFLKKERAKRSRTQLFVGHEGGDDFFLIGQKTTVRETVRNIYKAFSESTLALFNKKEIAQGYYEGKSRKGSKEKYPLLTISTAIIHIPASDKSSFDLLSEVAAAEKKKAKSKTGNTITEFSYSPIVKPGNADSLFSEDNSSKADSAKITKRKNA